MRRRKNGEDAYPLPVADGRELGEHEALVRLHVARAAHAQAHELKRGADLAVVETERELDVCKREVRKAAER